MAQLLLPNAPSPFPCRYNGPNLVLKYDRAQKRLVNIAVDERSSPYYALRDRQGNAIGVTACDIDGDGHEEIYFLNTNNAFSGKGWGLGPLPPTCYVQAPPRGRALGTLACLTLQSRAPPGTVPCWLRDLILSQQEDPFFSYA